MRQRIQQILDVYLKRIQSSADLKQLDEIFLELFGKKGAVTLLPKDFINLPRNELKELGPLFNRVKLELEEKIERKRHEIREEKFEKIISEPIDITRVPAKKERIGQLHPLTEFEQEIVLLFSKIGFQRFDGPLIDTDKNNFELLNIPSQHPARDLWDTLYIKEEKDTAREDELLLRTHTSNSQIHIMKQFKPPIRMVILGRCFRYENLDARHEHTFDQFELVYIDRGLSMANLQYLSEYYFKEILGTDIRVRMKPKYYPFVEPTAGIDALCIFCKGEGCRICGEGWIELAGAGMIHPTVLKNGGIDPNEYSGIAWGTGLERFLMLKYGIEDVRLFRNGDLSFLKNFKLKQKGG